MYLSNTAIDMYSNCGYKYKLHYIKKLRPTWTSSALHFGGSLDDALNHVLLQKLENRSKAQDDLLADFTPHQIFDISYKTVEINEVPIDMLETDKMSWTKGDFEVNLLQDGDFAKLSELLPDFEINRETIYTLEADCLAMLKESKKVYGDLKKAHHLICYLATRRKAHLLIDAYITGILPQIAVVHGIQIPLELPNGKGDKIVGYIDFDATFTDGVRRVIDNKTSSTAYNDEKLATSQQLALYSEFLQNRNVGYAVLVKTLRKKAPFVRTQLMFGTISEELLQNVFDKVGEVEYNIKEQKFDKNFDGCFAFGQRCPYYAHCRDFNNVDNLVCLKKE